MSNKDLRDKIRAFYKKLSADRDHRYRSWEHCYGFFSEATENYCHGERQGRTALRFLFGELGNVQEALGSFSSRLTQSILESSRRWYRRSSLICGKQKLVQSPQHRQRGHP